MRRAELEQLFHPLSLEQSLHLLDSLTWFPQPGPDGSARIADYVNTRADGASVDTATIDSVLERIDESAAPDDDPALGRWADIRNAKILYSLKYDLKTFLLPDPWFTFMNMGWQEVGAPDPDLREWLPGGQDVWRYSANLYDMVASRMPLAGRDVLEVGSGRGGGAGFVVRKHLPSSYTTVEQSENNVEFARAVQPSEIDFRVGDAESMAVDDDSIDAVINIESAHCYPKPQAILRRGRSRAPAGRAAAVRGRVVDGAGRRAH